jgi:HK97 family phage major capsid protein
MTTPFTTSAAVESLRPNIYTFPPADLIPDALIIVGTTKVATVEGDEPTVRAPFLDVGVAGFVPEGDEIPDNELDSREVVIATGKVAILTSVSREQYSQTGVTDLLSTELRRAMTVKADRALLSQEAPTAPAMTPPAGLLEQDHTEGGSITDNLDALADAVATIEGHNGIADLIIASPASWAAVSKLKVDTDSNASLLGPPGVAAERQLLVDPGGGERDGGR